MGTYYKHFPKNNGEGKKNFILAYKRNQEKNKRSGQEAQAVCLVIDLQQQLKNKSSF